MRNEVLLSVLVIGWTGSTAWAQESPALRTAERSIENWRSFAEDAGAKKQDVWQQGDDGVMVCKGSPLGYLHSERDCTDVTLEFDWRWPLGGRAGNGGLLLRLTGEHKIWPKSLEVQLNADQAGDFWGLGGYMLAGPADRMETLEHPKFGRLTHVKRSQGREKPPGEWNHCAVELRGDRITVSINGQVVNTATGCEIAAGKLALTAEGNEIHFRRFRVVSSK